MHQDSLILAASIAMAGNLPTYNISQSWTFEGHFDQSIKAVMTSGIQGDHLCG